MENLYEILGCSPSATADEIRDAYQKQILRLHPDKLQQYEADMTDCEREEKLHQYHAANRAWKVLGDANCRKEFDASWKQRTLAQLWPVQDDVEFEDFDFDVDSSSYSHACRCGGEYRLTESDATFRVDYVCCAFCSLCVKVVYSDPELDGDGDPQKDSHDPVKLNGNSARDTDDG